MFLWPPRLMRDDGSGLTFAYLKASLCMGMTFQTMVKALGRAPSTTSLDMEKDPRVPEPPVLVSSASLTAEQAQQPQPEETKGGR